MTFNPRVAPGNLICDLMWEALALLHVVLSFDYILKFIWYDHNYPKAFSHRIGGNRKTLLEIYARE